MPTELDYLIKDHKCALVEIAALEVMLVHAREDLAIAEAGINRLLDKN